MEMETLTPTLLRELIDHIDVYETQGTGKHRTQRITIFYRFVGYIDIPESPEDDPYTADTRQGVEEGTSPNWHKNSRHKACKTRIKAEKTGVHNKSVMNTRNGKSTARGYNAPCFAGVVHFCGVCPDAPNIRDRRDRIITIALLLLPFGVEVLHLRFFATATAHDTVKDIMNVASKRAIQREFRHTSFLQRPP